MGLARAEEAGHPDPDLAANVAVAPVVNRFEVGADEPAQMDIQFPGDDVLIQLLPDRFVVELIGLDDTVNGTADGFGKQILDQHHGVIPLID